MAASSMEPAFDLNQFGCRRQRSTTHALVAMTHAWQSALDRGRAARALFVDFKRNLTQLIIIYCYVNFILEMYPHCLIRWFFSYLENRMQRVPIGTNHSNWPQLNGAMFQGSWLGPYSFFSDPHQQRFLLRDDNFPFFTLITITTSS